MDDGWWTVDGLCREGRRSHNGRRSADVGRGMALQHCPVWIDVGLSHSTVGFILLWVGSTQQSCANRINRMACMAYNIIFIKSSDSA